MQKLLLILAIAFIAGCQRGAYILESDELDVLLKVDGSRYKIVSRQSRSMFPIGTVLDSGRVRKRRGYIRFKTSADLDDFAFGKMLEPIYLESVGDYSISFSSIPKDSSLFEVGIAIHNVLRSYSKKYPLSQTISLNEFLNTAPVDSFSSIAIGVYPKFYEAGWFQGLTYRASSASLQDSNSWRLEIDVDDWTKVFRYKLYYHPAYFRNDTLILNGYWFYPVDVDSLDK